MNSFVFFPHQGMVHGNSSSSSSLSSLDSLNMQSLVLNSGYFSANPFAAGLNDNDIFSCRPTKIFLFDTRSYTNYHLDYEVYVSVPTCVRSYYINSFFTNLKRSLQNNYVTISSQQDIIQVPFIYEYIREFYQLMYPQDHNNTTYLNNVDTEAGYCDWQQSQDFLYNHAFIESQSDIDYTLFPQELLCKCRRVEATSGSFFKGIAAGCYSAFQLATFRNEENFLNFIENWTLDIINLGVNFNIATIVITFLKLFKMFMPISHFVIQLVSTFQELFQSLCSKIGKTTKHFLSPSPTQPSTGAETAILEALSGGVESSSGLLENFEFLEPILQYAVETPVISSLMATFVVMSGSIILGTQSISGKTKLNAGDKIACCFNNISKAKGGLYSCLEMIKDMSSHITNFIRECIGGENDSALMRAIVSTDIQDTESDKKLDLIKYIDYYLDPANKEEITFTTSLHNRLRFCINIIDNIEQRVAKGELRLHRNTLNYLLLKVIELKKIRNYVIKNSPSDPYRMTPMWINLVGDPGTGKSVFTPLLTSTMLTILQKDNKYGIPEKEAWVYPVNFVDKYLTKYHGQYCVTIDDLFQDSAPLGDRSSALDIIAWVSCIPSYTVQADLESKGIPFTSQLIVSTSNDQSLDNRKEVIDTKAIKRRMEVLCIFEKDSNVPLDPNLPPGIKLVIKDPLTKLPIKTCNSNEFIAYCVDAFKKHYAKEEELKISRKPTEEHIQTVMGLMAPTSGWFSRCNFGLTPLLRDRTRMGSNIASWKEFDCECKRHADLNLLYSNYIRIFDESDAPFTAISILDYAKQYENHVEEETIEYNNSVDRVISRLKRLCSSQAGRLIFKALAAACGAIVMCASYKFLKPIVSGSSNETPESDGYNSDDSDDTFLPTAAKYDLGKPVRAKNNRISRIKPASMPKQLPSSVVASDGIYAHYQRHQRDFQAEQQIVALASLGSVVRVVRDSDGLVNVAIMIKSNYMLTNHHYFSEFKEGDTFTIYANTAFSETRIQQTFYKEGLRRIDDLDACIYQCDRSVMCRFKSIVKYFPNNEEVKMTDTPAVVMTAVPSFQTIVNVNANLITCNVPYDNKSNTESYRLLKGYSINYSVQFGQSGSLLIGLDKTQTRKILGIQACRDVATHQGYFIPITQNDIEKTLATFEDTLEYELDIDAALERTNGVVDSKRPENLAKNSLYYVGTVDKTRFVKPQLKTKITPSLISDPSEWTQEPSVLSDKDDRMQVLLQGKPVIYRAVEGFDSPIGTLDRSILSKAVNELKLDFNFSLNSKQIKRSILSNFETINGVPGLIKRIEMNSSPGWPYCVERRNTNLGGKYEWFTEIDDLPEGYTLGYQMVPKLARGLERRENLAKKGINLPTIAYVCLKDETRPLEKIIDGKTRAFICLPMDYNLLVKKYFGAFIATQHQLAGQISSCVGIDPALQWKKLYDRLNAKNIYWEDFDYKNWDQHLHPELVYQVASIVNHWYGDSDNSENGLLRRVLILDLIHTIIIVKDRLMIKSTGQCSGCAITAELNCIVHELLMFYVWIKLHQDNDLTTDIGEFRDAVAMGLYGDDIVLAVDNARIEFSGNSIKPIMNELGMNITPGNKKSTTFTLKKPNELEFLKRSFIEEGNFVKAPLRTEVIENIYQWIHKSDSPIEATRTNCEASLQEAYMHNRKYFDKLIAKINTKIDQYNSNNIQQIQPVIKSYDDYDRKYRRAEFMCVGVPKSANMLLKAERM